MLNPQRWGASSTNSAANSGYVQDFEKGTDGALFDIGVDEDDEEERPKKRVRKSKVGSDVLPELDLVE